MKHLEIAYIGGGSMAWARNLMNDLVLEQKLSGNVRLFDIDPEAARMNEVIGNLYNEAKGAATTWSYKAVSEMDEALFDADFVIISILPGTFDLMEKDVHYPEKYGIFQSVGDTVGPGGIMRSVRAIPMYRHITERIKAVCPDAYIISYTNPMTVLTKTIFSVFPKAKAFGCCHEVFGSQRLIAKVLELEGIESDVDRSDIRTNVLGINHFTWLDRIEFRGKDVFPIYRDFAKAHHKSGFSEKGNWDETYFSSGNRVKFDLFTEYGIAAAAGDRHLAEFCPGWYLKDPETVKRWQFSLTPVSWRKNDRIERIERTRKLFSGEEKPEIINTGEEGVRLIKALSGLSEELSNVNTLNMGQHIGLPGGAVVETNAVFSGRGIEPVSAGRLPKDVEILVQRHIYNQEALVKACLEYDMEEVFRVFINDPLVHLPKDTARTLFGEMFEMNRSFWN